MSLPHGISERGRAFLQGVRASSPSADPAGALALVAGQGLPVFPALRDFEADFGGLSFSWRTHHVQLGPGWAIRRRYVAVYPPTQGSPTQPLL